MKLFSLTIDFFLSSKCLTIHNNGMLKINLNASSKINIALGIHGHTLSAIVERIEFSKNEILLASRHLNEIILNNILRKA
jgi:hypothetical protein